MGKKRPGRPAVDRERYPSGRAKPADRDVASPYALAKRAVLADPMAAAKSLKKAEADARKEHHLKPADNLAAAQFSAEDAARAVAKSLPTGASDRASTALGRYSLWSRHRGGAKYRLTEAQYLAGVMYADLHGATWAGLRDDLAAVSARTDGLLPVSSSVVPRRHPPAHLGNIATSAAPVDLAPKPKLTPEEQRERRQKLWARYRAARETLLRCSLPVTLAVEDLVIEDHDPWWVERSPDRMGEAEARQRAAGVFRQRAMIRDGLVALAKFFGTDKDEPTPPAAEPKPTQQPDPAAPSPRPRQDRMPFIF